MNTNNPYGVGGFSVKSKFSVSVTLQWNMGTTASGELQQYKNGKWTTIYTADKATVTSYTVKWTPRQESRLSVPYPCI